MVRKKLLIFLVLVISFLGMAVSPVKISWWVPNWDEPEARELIKQFENENPGIKVEIIITTWDTMADKIRVALMSGNSPDVITDLETMVPIYAQKNLLTNLDSYYERDLDKNDFVDSALELNSYEGSLYGVPFRHDGSGMFYNKNLFREIGLDAEEFPKTWEEYINVAKKLTIDRDGDGRIDQYGFAWCLGDQANAVVRYLQLLYSYGGDILNEDKTKCTLDSPEAIKAMEELRNTIVEYHVAPLSSMELDNTGLRELFINQRIAMYVGGAFDIEPIQNEAPFIDLGTAVIPGPDGMGTTTVNGFSLIIPQKAKHPEEAWQLVKFIAQPQNMAFLTDSFPARKSALDLPQFNTPLLKPFALQLQKGKPEPYYENWPEMEKLIYYYMQKIILTDSINVEREMQELTKEIDRILKK